VSGPAGPQGPGISWNAVSTPTAAQPNTGYLAIGSSTEILTLPANPTVGDLFAITGVGPGGWSVVTDGAAFIQAGSSANSLIPAGTNWSLRDGVRPWRVIASSSDGSKLVAAVYGGQIYTSTDSGVTWTPRASTGFWQALASSSDGTKLVAGTYNSFIYISSDSGATWTVSPGSSSKNWTSLASSSDGTKLVAAVGGSGQLYTSANSGVSWTLQAASPVANWHSVASSSDGSKLIAAAYGGNLYTSVDSGVTWTARDSSRQWQSVASSDDGTKLVAAVQAGSEYIYTSSNSGLTWTQQPAAGSRDWYSVASSSDGTRLLAGAFNGQLYISSDSGVSWAPHDSSGQWWAVASSGDGNKLAAVDGSGQIHTSTATILTGSSGLFGPQGSSIQLQYIGNNQYQLVSYFPAISVAQGGVGSRTSIGAAASGANSDITSLSGLTTPLFIPQGGTGAITSAGARINLGAAASGVNSDISSLTGLTTGITIPQGGTGAITAAGARTNLGAAASGTNNDITSLNGLTTPLSIARGGTGSTTSNTARISLGAAASGANSDITSLNGLSSSLAIAQGGTGATTALEVRANLAVPGLGTSNTFSGKQLIQTGSSNSVGLAVQGTSGQSSNLQEWQDGGGTTIASVSAAGVFAGNGSGLTNVIQIFPIAGPAGSNVPGYSNYVFVGPTVVITTTSSQRLVGSGVAVLGTSSGNPIEFGAGLCFRQSGSGNTPVNFVGGNYISANIASADGKKTFAASASVVPGFGSWDVGYCVKNSGTANLDNNDNVNGWIMVVN
jgi:hypothetical protein